MVYDQVLKKEVPLVQRNWLGIFSTKEVPENYQQTIDSMFTYSGKSGFDLIDQDAYANFIFRVTSQWMGDDKETITNYILDHMDK